VPNSNEIAAKRRETVFRKRVTSHPAERILAKLILECPTLQVEQVIEDKIPDVIAESRISDKT
jgi:hypothetical protein